MQKKTQLSGIYSKLVRCFFLMWNLWSESDSYCVADLDVLRIRTWGFNSSLLPWFWPSRGRCIELLLIPKSKYNKALLQNKWFLQARETALLSTASMCPWANDLRCELMEMFLFLGQIQQLCQAVFEDTVCAQSLSRALCCCVVTLQGWHWPLAMRDSSPS